MRGQTSRRSSGECGRCRILSGPSVRTEAYEQPFRHGDECRRTIRKERERLSAAEAWNVGSEAGPSNDAPLISYYGSAHSTGYYPVAGMDMMYCSGPSAQWYGQTDAVMRCPISPPAGPGLRRGSRRAFPSRRSAGISDGTVQGSIDLGTAS